eukprot:TRINITY_DN267_c1_g1_i4.p1 TRINITY_DN267_c1_g1~~TRINITY_DN267_c1_g1_i4.p1  ORF type:complete len:542 (+),score=25.67 TRINITY_DN267_c1_g1_i4:108-1733(+)
MVFTYLSNFVVCTLLVAGVRNQTTPFIQVDDECKDNNNAKVLNGVNAEPGEYPFMVSLQIPHRMDPESYFEHHCAGTLISTKMILTAAHCVWSQGQGLNLRDGGSTTGPIDKSIKAAINPYCRHQSGSGLYNIQTYHIHPDYQGNVEGGADIALLELEEDYNGITKFLDYENSGSFDSLDELIILGWGLSNAEEANNLTLYVTSVKPLQQATVTMRDECSSTSTFCAVGSTATGGTIDTCRGDSGGPVLQAFGNDYVIVGITSYGIGIDCQEGSKGIYTRVSYYREWISNTLRGGVTIDPIRKTQEDSYQSIAEFSQGECVSYSTRLNQVANNQGYNILSPNGNSFTIGFKAQDCAAACEAINSKCGFICCDSFTFSIEKMICWLKFGDGRDSSYNSQGWQSYWRESSGGDSTYQVCEEDWKTTGYAHAYMTKGPRQLAVDQGISLSTSNGLGGVKALGVENCANECEAVSTCNSFTYNPRSRDCYLKQGQNFTTIQLDNNINAGWQSYWQLTGSTAQSECSKSTQYCIYCGGTLNNCRGY